MKVFHFYEKNFFLQFAKIHKIKKLTKQPVDKKFFMCGL